MFVSFVCLFVFEEMEFQKKAQKMHLEWYIILMPVKKAHELKNYASFFLYSIAILVLYFQPNIDQKSGNGRSLIPRAGKMDRSDWTSCAVEIITPFWLDKSLCGNRCIV